MILYPCDCILLHDILPLTEIRHFRIAPKYINRLGHIHFWRSGTKLSHFTLVFFTLSKVDRLPVYIVIICVKKYLTIYVFKHETKVDKPTVSRTLWQRSSH